MKYANVAVNTPVDATFDYHIPPELEGQLQVGHLVQVNFRTSMDHAIILALHDEAEVERTKPIIARLDPRPVVNEEQIALSWWMSRAYRAPMGLCVWMWLPPGLTGHRDVLVSLREQYAAELVADPVEEEVVALLKRRGTLSGHQLNLALAGKNWRVAVEGLEKYEVVTTESVLSPPRVRPRIVQTASLAIHPKAIAKAARGLERTSRTADLLETVAQAQEIDARAALKASGATKSHIDKLIEAGWIEQLPDQTLRLVDPAMEIQPKLDEMRKLDKPLRILNILARAGEPVDVSWIYAQADASLADLKRLEEEDLILLSEQQRWRDSLAERDFVSTTPPTLTPAQQTAWERLEAAIRKAAPARPQPEPEPDAEPEDNADLYDAMERIARQKRRDPSPAENRLWDWLRKEQPEGFRFRRQQPIERFIVDFFCHEAALVIEVDGDYRQYTRDEEETRQAYLESLGLVVLRFSDREIAEDWQDVTRQITDTVIDQAEYAEELEPLPVGTFARKVFGGEVRVADARVEEATAPPVQPEPEPEPQGATFLLHGVTGSGKTELYLRAIERTLALGRSAIFLVPEIALTPQTVRRVAARFPGKTAVVHSGLGEGERYDTWRRARDGLVQVVVGARSALFTPLPDVGLIVLDEEHDSSYKQSPPVLPPYYHARELAEEMMQRNHGVVMLGSATPDVETTYRVERGEVEKLELPRRIMGHRVHIGEQAERAGVLPRYQPGADTDSASAEDAVMIDLPPVQVVDMRSELKEGNSSIFSRALQRELKATLDRNEQAILFINRRGQSTFVFCRDCGYVARCPRCDMPLTHHRLGSALRCHHCGFTQPEPTVCPQCGSKRIKFFGAGTQQVEATLVEMFPQARVVRWDSDTASSAEAHEAILQRFIERRADVMVGTQMVAKGLDLPLVTLVGVVSADIGVALPDFRAGERTFQLLTQVAGRAGRGLLGGRVVLQTYQPTHYAIAAAARHDYAAFYQREIAYRREIGYPPFRRLVRILFRFPNETKAQQEAERAAAILRHRLDELHMTGTELIGPAPCFFTRENDVFRWQVLLRGPDPTTALEGIDIPRGWYVDVDPVEVM